MKHLEAVKSALTSQKLDGALEEAGLLSTRVPIARSVLYVVVPNAPRIKQKGVGQGKGRLVPGKTTTLELHLPKGCTYLTPVNMRLLVDIVAVGYV